MKPRPAPQLRENAGEHRLLRPVTCVDCGAPLKDLATYGVSRCGPGFFYHCPDCARGRGATS